MKSGQKPGTFQESTAERRILALKFHRRGMLNKDICEYVGIDHSTLARYLQSPDNGMKCSLCGDFAITLIGKKPICRECLCPDVPDSVENYARTGTSNLGSIV